MKTVTKSLSLYFLCSVIVTIFLILMRLIIMINYYDVTTELYTSDAQSITFFSIVFLFGSLAMLTMMLFMRKPSVQMLSLPPVTQFITFSGALCGFGLIAAVILQCCYFLTPVLHSGSKADRVLFGLTLILCIPCAVYFFLAISLKQKNVKALQYFSFAPILWGIAYSAFFYFDSTRVLNSPERNYIQISVIVLMIYFLLETRYHLGKAKPALYFGISLLSIVVIGTVTVPNLLLSAFWLMPFTKISVYTAVELLMMIYIISRMISFISVSKHVSVDAAQSMATN